LDTLNQTRLKLEAEAVLGLLELVQSGKIVLLSSTVLELETARNPLAARREHGQQILARATETIVVDPDVENRARTLVDQGLTAMDALHIAAAESAKAEYFCTCDDQILRKATSISPLHTRVVSPLELIEVIEP
jgi:predicted nucleic acid-binding protein